MSKGLVVVVSLLVLAPPVWAQVPAGGEFRANTYTTGNQDTPGVGMGRDGRFVIAWQSPNIDGSNDAVVGQRYAAPGTPQGANFQVNTYTTNSQYEVAVAVARDGSFVVVWHSLDQEGVGGNLGVFGQRHDASGNRLGGEFQVNTYTTDFQYGPTVAMASSGAGFDGNFVVVWDSNGQDGSSYGVFGQRFNASGSRLGAEFQVNTYTTNEQYEAKVTADARGNFVVAWQSDLSGITSDEVMARRFAFNGNARGAEFRVNTYTTNGQGNASIASDAVGNFAVAWESYPQDGSSRGVFGQRFGGLFPRALRVDTTGNNVWEPGETVDVRPTWRNDNGAPQTFNEQLGGISGPPGAVYAIIDGTGDYGTVPNATDRECTDCYQVSVDNPATRPVQHWDATALQSIFPDTQGQRLLRTLHIGNSFTDVPATNGFYRFIETLLHNGVTGGCGGTSYCPAASTTRDQMSVFVLVAKEGAGYVPPACTTPVFNDVPASNPFCRFIEELARRSVVSGCGGGNYCPASPVTREQMSIFVLRTLDPALSPPACTTPVFADVPASSPFCRWIEELARRGVVTGCGGGNYCPTASVTREQMGVFIGVSFSLSLYGP